MNLKISKYDPSVDTAPKLVAFNNIPWHQGMTVLEAIQLAHEQSPVAFDYNCRARACGRCAVTLDGSPVLACVAQIGNANHTIEPLAGQPVVRDLIVDRSEAHAALAARYKRIKDPTVDLTSDSVIENTFNVAAIEQINAIEWCTRCLVCTAGCPVRKANPSSYVGPADLLAVAYRHYDRYDAGSRIAEAVQDGLWNCIMCGQCDKLCPQKEIRRVPQIWKDLRSEATVLGYRDPNAS